ncbi:MAG TPA: flagellar hook-associated protein FlgL [Paucimonas sp.]|nr:flagellar hook-associated protein FlgL [Paucimonas sp.]
MRISTTTVFESGAARLSELQAGMLKGQQQIATGRKMLTPADDPVASARALELTQSRMLNEQYGTNRDNAKASLSQEEVALQSVTSLLQDARTLTVASGSGILDDQQRRFYATELRGRFDDLLALANTRDGTGNFMFAGYQVTDQPFVKSGTSVTYNGDQGQRLLQVDSARQLAMSDSGDAVFMNIPTGNGEFVTAPGTNAITGGPNSGSGIVSEGSVVDASLLTGDSYTVTFTVTAGVSTYNVVNTTTGNPVGALNVPYVSGQSISFDGMQFAITGTPNDGDVFTVNPSANQSVFTTLSNLISTLEKPADTAAAKANLANGLASALTNLDNALDNVLTVRASVGARLKEIEALNDIGSDRDLQYAQTLSELQELDYTKAISELTQLQMTLTAAQQSFVKITDLSLFNFLR